MHISSLEEYGVRCALQLARNNEKGPLSASKIAEAEGISVEYVSKIMHLFRKTGLIQSVRGIQGGFTLNNAPKNITLKNVFDSLAGKKSIGDFCNHYSGHQNQCVHTEDCTVRPIWSLISTYFNSFLSGLSLHDLELNENQIESKIVNLAQMKSNTLRDQVQTKHILKGSKTNEANATL